jgi:hypothetical protein
VNTHADSKHERSHPTAVTASMESKWRETNGPARRVRLSDEASPISGGSDSGNALLEHITRGEAYQYLGLVVGRLRGSGVQVQALKLAEMEIYGVDQGCRLVSTCMCLIYVCVCVCVCVCVELIMVAGW